MPIIAAVAPIARRFGAVVVHNDNGFKKMIYPIARTDFTRLAVPDVQIRVELVREHAKACGGRPLAPHPDYVVERPVVRVRVLQIDVVHPHRDDVIRRYAIHDGAVESRDAIEGGGGPHRHGQRLRVVIIGKVLDFDDHIGRDVLRDHVPELVAVGRRRAAPSVPVVVGGCRVHRRVNERKLHERRPGVRQAAAVLEDVVLHDHHVGHEREQVQDRRDRAIGLVERVGAAATVVRTLLLVAGPAGRRLVGKVRQDVEDGAVLAPLHAHVQVVVRLDVARVEGDELVLLGDHAVGVDQPHRRVLVLKLGAEVALILLNGEDQVAPHVRRVDGVVEVDPAAGTDLAVLLVAQRELRLDAHHHGAEAHVAALRRALHPQEKRARGRQAVGRHGEAKDAVAAAGVVGEDLRVAVDRHARRRRLGVRRRRGDERGLEERDPERVRVVHAGRGAVDDLEDEIGTQIRLGHVDIKIDPFARAAAPVREVVEDQRADSLRCLMVGVVVQLVALGVRVGERLGDDVVRATRRATHQAEVVRARLEVTQVDLRLLHHAGLSPKVTVWRHEFDRRVLVRGQVVEVAAVLVEFEAQVCPAGGAVPPVVVVIVGGAVVAGAIARTVVAAAQAPAVAVVAPAAGAGTVRERVVQPLVGAELPVLGHSHRELGVDLQHDHAEWHRHVGLGPDRDEVGALMDVVGRDRDRVQPVATRSSARVLGLAVFRDVSIVVEEYAERVGVQTAHSRREVLNLDHQVVVRLRLAHLESIIRVHPCGDRAAH
mmetsp:Transcript_106103/g.306993  ORF Transcript_106103/g.306993 Transcript_106103/m.306993 type:complete len:768 (-) Transcript_106103:526-2829(-)